jgi:peptidyl-prolyl cis-trans isomerase B (cyclophilin B)
LPEVVTIMREGKVLNLRAAGVALIAGVLVTTGATPAFAATAAPPRVTHGPCQYTETPDEPAARPVPLPPDPRHTPSRGTVDVDLKTNRGPIPLTLVRSKAPCTVQSFVHLVEHKFYDKTICHRLTAYPTLKVLQCGDPSGTGEGGPGYKFKDELPTDLPPAPTDPTGARKVYARGTVAMANAGPDTNGSQFFLVYADSALRPNYSIFGTVDRAGLATLDRIAAGGVAPSPDDPTGVDGPPALTTKILKAKAHC